MTMATPTQGILLVDDGELDEVARVLEAEGLPFQRLRGGQIPAEIAPPQDLLIVTPRRVERVRRGSPAEARPGRPLRIIAVEEDSPAMRRRLRQSGLHLLIRQTADSEIWRMLIARALYRGSERRADPRVAVGSPVALDVDASSASQADRSTVLVDLSNRGCRLLTPAALSIGDPIEFTIPVDGESWCDQGPLTLRGQVRRVVSESIDSRSMLAIVFDAEMPDSCRTRLTTLINHWASGPRSPNANVMSGAPAIPSCQLPSLPDLTLDDETDPPIQATSEVCVQLGRLGKPGAGSSDADGGPSTSDRRKQARGRYESPLLAERDEGPFVLIGRDLSAAGMRIEHHPDLRLGDRFRIGLHGPTPGEPFLVDAKIVRDDGMEGFGVVFDHVDSDTAAELEKMVACLPDVESLEDGEIAGLGAILSEILTA
jgi:hypothetical protein